MTTLDSRTPLRSQSDASTTSQLAEPGTSRGVLAAPAWVQNLYSKFPLITLEQEQLLSWERPFEDGCILWIHPPSSSPHMYQRRWASRSPGSLRAQLLFLLRGVPVAFRSWTNEAAAPGSKLPSLHLPAENKLVEADGVRSWLDQRYPLKGKNKELQGMPSQEAYDKALAVAQLILGYLLPAYLSSISAPDIHLLASKPPPLAMGFTTPLPAALTGDARDSDHEELVAKGVDALHAVESVIEGDWALGARSPTPLDALIVSHVYPLFGLPATSALRMAAENSSLLGEYVDRVMSAAGAHTR